MVLISDSLMANDVKHLFKCLLSVYSTLSYFLYNVQGLGQVYLFIFAYEYSNAIALFIESSSCIF